MNQAGACSLGAHGLVRIQTSRGRHDGTMTERRGSGLKITSSPCRNGDQGRLPR